MRSLRHLSYSDTTFFLASSAFLAGCSGFRSGIDGDPDGPGSGGASPMRGGTSSVAGGGDPDVCIRGVPATSQDARPFSREYDAARRDLVGATTLASAANSSPS